MSTPVWSDVVNDIWFTGVEIIYEQWKLLLDEAQGQDEYTEIRNAIFEIDDFFEE